MVTQQEAERLAQECIRKYLEDCSPKTVTDAGNVLMKLSSVAGIALCATVGGEEAAARLQGVAQFIKKNMPDIQTCNSKVKH